MSRAVTAPMSAVTAAPMSALNANDDVRERHLVPMCTIGAVSSVVNLLDLGASVDHENKAGWTPLLAASFAGQHEVVGLLIQRGAHVNRPSPYGDVLRVACRQGYAK